MAALRDHRCQDSWARILHKKRCCFVATENVRAAGRRDVFRPPAHFGYSKRILSNSMLSCMDYMD